MRPLLSGITIFVFAINPIVGAQLSAEQPTIETLVAGIPVLDPHNDALTSFRFECEVMTWFESPIIAKLVWSRPDRFGMMVTAGDERTPFLFLSAKKAMDFDITTGTVFLREGAGPGLVVQTDGQKMTLNLSMTSEAKTKVAIDLPSFLADATKNGQLLQEPKGDWRLTSVSKSGNSKVIGVFRNCKGFPIRLLELRSVVDDSLMLAIRDISVDTDAAWPEFPAVHSFPQGLKVTRIGDIKVEEHSDGIDVVARGVRTMAAQGALRNPKWRNIPFLYNVDWDHAQKNNDDFGPRLQVLLNVRWAEQSDSPELPIGSELDG